MPDFLIAGVEIDTRKLENLIAALRGDDPAELVATHLEADVAEHWSAVSPASAGTPPGIDTGALSNSIHKRKISFGVWSVGDGVEYGIYLEIGTERMAARPWMMPAVQRVSAALPGVITRWFEAKL